MPDAARPMTAWLDALMQDVRYAVRGLRLRPGFTIMVVATLSLGIGANATMFGILDRLLLRAPGQIVEPERVVQFNSRWLGSDFGFQASQPYQVYKDLRDGVPDFERVAVTTPSSVVDRAYFPLGRGAGAARVAGAQVSPDFFPLLGVRALRGRFFTEAEAGEANPQKVAVIGYGFWQRHFAGSDDAVGQTLELGADRYSVVGVAPKGFTGVELSDIDVWIPIAAADGLRFIKTPDWSTTRSSQWLTIVARLKPGVRVEHAEAQALLAFRAGERIRYAEANNRGTHPDSVVVALGSIVPGRSLRSFGMSTRSPELQVSRLLGGVSFLVLLIACANVANLLFARALGRRREIAVRLALGVTRRRLTGQLIIEGLLLSLLGGLGALACAQVASGSIRRLLLADSAWTGTPIDGRMLAFTAVAALATGLLTSLLPAIQAGRAQLTSDLKSGARDGGGARSRVRTGLLVLQSALAIVLLVGAGLFVRSMRNVAALPLGVDIDRLLVVQMEHSSVGMTTAEARESFRRFTERAPQVPGITGAATSIAMSFGLGWSARLSRPGREAPKTNNNPSQYAVTPEYFGVMGVRLLSGRTFTDFDRAGTPLVAVINETTANTFWPGESPIGQCVKVGADTMPCTTVVGVVTNARRQSLIEGPVSQIYRPLDQLPQSLYDRTVSIFGFSMVARTDRDPATLAEPLRRALQATDPRVPYIRVQPLTNRLGRQTRSWTLGATMFSIFGALALVIAAIGLYAVVTFSMAQRQHEFGVRAALGATTAHLVRLTVVRGVAPVVFGILFGLGVAIGFSRLMEGLLFELSPRDPRVLATASGVLLVAALLASLVPARRIARTNPVDALRSE